MTFLAVDGDQIGKRLEGAILRNDIDAVVALSNAIRQHFEAVSELLERHGLRVRLTGGDIVIAEGTVTPFVIETVLALRGVITHSTGIGDTVLEAHLALRAAKAAGGGCARQFRRDASTALWSIEPIGSA